MVRVHEAVGSNPATRTKNPPFSNESGGFFAYYVMKNVREILAFRSDHTNTTDGFPAGPQEGHPVSAGSFFVSCPPISESTVQSLYLKIDGATRQHSRLISKDYN